MKTAHSALRVRCRYSRSMSVLFVRDLDTLRNVRARSIGTENRSAAALRAEHACLIVSDAGYVIRVMGEPDGFPCERALVTHVRMAALDTCAALSFGGAALVEGRMLGIVVGRAEQ